MSNGRFSKFVLFFTVVFIIINVACNDSKPKYNIEAKLNPFGIVPLSAQLNISSELPFSVTVEVLGESPISHSIDAFKSSHSVPVLGLYPARENDVLVSLKFEDQLVEETIKITTAALPEFFPDIEIDKLDRERMSDGLHSCDIHFANNGKFKSLPLFFDDQGEVRWFLDMSFHGRMVGLFQKLRDGTVVVFGRQSIYKYNMIGQQIDKIYTGPNYGFHHDLVELPDGNLMMAVGKQNTFISFDGKRIPSDNDFLALFDFKSNQYVQEWDLAENLDVSRSDINNLRPNDWIHCNSIVFDDRDSSMILSGKTQGIFKISWDNELKWILAPHKNWGASGRDNQGFDTKPYLLTAVDADKQKLSAEAQLGNISLENFDFPWGQHGLELLPNNNLIAFDNGNMRNFNTASTYSRAVEYHIDEKEGTVHQVWQYGKERGLDFFSSIVSDVDYLSETDNMLISSGHVNPMGRHGAKIVEVDYGTKEEVFEASLYFKNTNGNRTKSWGQRDILYRSERMPLEF